MGCKNKLFFLVLVLVLAISFSFVSATNCWEYSEDTNCDSDTNCQWKTDSWGGWCEELNCWNLWTQDDCTNTVVPNKQCNWKDSTSWGWCEQTSCWSFWDTNETYCENSTAHTLNCEW